MYVPVKLEISSKVISMFQSGYGHHLNYSEKWFSYTSIRIIVPLNYNSNSFLNVLMY